MLKQHLPNWLRRIARAARRRIVRPKPVTYQSRMEAELERYREVENVHDLPAIFHVWSDRYVRSKMEAVLEVSSFNSFYTKYILGYAGRHPEQPVEIASLGAGNGDMEVGLGKLLHEQGFTNYRFHCLDVNPDMLARGASLAAAAGLSENFVFERVDVARWQPGRPFGVVMASQSLHHFVELEAIFAQVKAAIGTDGYFLANDMIGRNGHMRWPEAAEHVEQIWRKMPNRYKYNHQLNRFEKSFVNWDCSLSSFEGIRAQEILPLLLRNFHFEAFVAYGNVVDVFVERSFGHNFDPHNPEDAAFIEEVGALDEQLLDEGKVKPTQMIAVMRATPVENPRFYRHWSAEFCVRPVERSK